MTDPWASEFLLSGFAASALAVLADAALKGTAVLLMAGLLSLLLRGASSALRHTVWLAAVCGSLLLPALALALPAWDVPLAWAPPVAALETTHDESRASMPAAAAVRVEPEAQAPPSMRRDAGPAPGVDWPVVAVLVWLAGALLVAGRTAAASLRVRAIVGRAERAEATWVDAARVASAHLGLARPIRLLVSERVAAPASWGITRPTVLLPSSCGWPADRRLAALLHEFAHVQRWDCATQLAAQIACAVYWFNPFIWAAARVLREERERAADDQVLGAGVRPSDYAGLLLHVARTAPSPLPQPVASFVDARRSQLERRVRSILDPRQPRRPAGRLAAIVLVLAATCAVAPLAAARRPAAPVREAVPVREDAAVPVREDAPAPPGETIALGGPAGPAGARGPAQESGAAERGGRPMNPSPRPTPTPTPLLRGIEGRVTGELAGEKTAVVAALEEALDDADEGVRKQAKWALDMIRLGKGELPPEMESLEERARPTPKIDVEPEVNDSVEGPDDSPRPEPR